MYEFMYVCTYVHMTRRTKICNTDPVTLTVILKLKLHHLWCLQLSMYKCSYIADAILLTETKIGKEHDTSEFLPKRLGGYKKHRNDRRTDCGGVLLAVKERTNQNIVYWQHRSSTMEVNLKNQNKMYIK